MLMRILKPNSIFSKLLVGLIFCGIIACSRTTTAPADPADTLVSNVKAINDALVPASLQVPSLLNAKEAIRALSGNPCDGVPGGLIGCQPVLLRLYMSIVIQFGGMMTTILTDVSTHFKGLADGATGSVTVDTDTVYYTKTSATKVAVLVKNADDVAKFYITMDGSDFSLKLNFAGMEPDPSDTSSPTSGGFEFSGSYTDANNWSATAFMASTSCSSDDVAAPANLRVQMTKTSDLWAGKAMMYNPRGVGSNTCDTTPADATSFTMYTDFAANADAANATVYFMQRSVSDLSSISAYGLDQMYANVPGLFGGDPGDMSAYAGDYCNLTNTIAATWNDSTCAVSASSYGPASEWITPANFYPMAVTLPTSL